MMIVVYRRLEKAVADELLAKIRLFFANHPRRKVIRVGLNDQRTLRIARGKEVDLVKEYAVIGWQPPA